MRNGFGLKLLHKFFNLPFLQLQRETLIKQLQTNEEETQLTSQELDLFQESEDADYDKFLDNLVHRRRVIADTASSTVLVPNVTSSLSTHHSLSSSSNNNFTQQEIRRSSSISGPIGGGTPIPTKQFEQKIPPKKEIKIPTTEFSQKNLTTMLATSTPNSQKSPEIIIDSVEKKDNRQQNFVTKMFTAKRPNDNCNTLDTPLASVEDFIPDDGMLDRSFLEDNNQSPQKNAPENSADTDSETETANPLVAGYEDDLSSGEDDPSMTIEPRLAENPLSKQKRDDKKKEPIHIKRDSISSSEQELRITNGDSSLSNDQQDGNSDTFDSWLGQDSKWRQSPEGGEDVSSTGTRKDKLELSDKSVDVSVTSSNVHLELLDNSSIRQVYSNSPSPVLKEKKKHRDKPEDKEKEKRRKKKSKDKDKEKNEKIERRKKRSQHRTRDDDNGRDELEEFLNGSAARPTIDMAYEAL